MTDPEHRPSIAELTQAALGDAPLVAPRPVPVETSMTKVYVAAGLLVLLVGGGIAGFVYRFHEDRIFRSNDPAVSFSTLRASEEEPLKLLEQIAAEPHSRIVVRAAHVTYTPSESPGVDGLAVELKGDGVVGGIDLLPLPYSVASDPALDGREVATAHTGESWVQITVAEDKAFLAEGHSVEETEAILAAMLHDEGIDVPHQGEGA